MKDQYQRITDLRQGLVKIQAVCVNTCTDPKCEAESCRIRRLVGETLAADQEAARA